jgi:hypothetical protein
MQAVTIACILAGIAILLVLGMVQADPPFGRRGEDARWLHRHCHIEVVVFQPLDVVIMATCH